ncbi:hypothetical protein LHK12_13870 [Providencia rettgeri]|nr:hypothetical protein [Providencia rettgeri]
MIDDEFERFCRHKKAILVLEEGQPNFVEQNVANILRQRKIDIALHGKDMLPMAGNIILQQCLRVYVRFLNAMER